jgi:hypothetical protein
MLLISVCSEQHSGPYMKHEAGYFWYFDIGSFGDFVSFTGDQLSLVPGREEEALIYEP